MKVVITGHRGFIGSNAMVRFGEQPDFDVAGISHNQPPDEIAAAVASADAVVHLAGVNRPIDDAGFEQGNAAFTAALVAAARAGGRAPAIIFASSTQADLDNPYGRSKKKAESMLRDYAAATGAAVHSFRLPNVFGKWSRPNYNSVVATFCHNISRELEIRVDNPDRELTLVHVDDVIDRWLAILRDPARDTVDRVEPEYRITVGELATRIRGFHAARQTMTMDRVGSGLDRALYSTYVSYLPPERFAYKLPMHADARGVFVEFLKTQDSGQFSFFIGKPGVTRGGHYHHTKTEKFLVIQGRAVFRFRHIVTNETREVAVSGDVSEVVETVPGWAHDITNVGEGDLVVMLWANEVFDRNRPDTVSSRTQ